MTCHQGRLSVLETKVGGGPSLHVAGGSRRGCNSLRSTCLKIILSSCIMKTTFELSRAPTQDKWGQADPV